MQFLSNKSFDGFLNSYQYCFYCYLEFDHCEMFAENLAQFAFNYYQSRCNEEGSCVAEIFYIDFNVSI